MPSVLELGPIRRLPPLHLVLYEGDTDPGGNTRGVKYRRRIHYRTSQYANSDEFPAIGLGVPKDMATHA